MNVDDSSAYLLGVACEGCDDLHFLPAETPEELGKMMAEVVEPGVPCYPLAVTALDATEEAAVATELEQAGAEYDREWNVETWNNDNWKGSEAK